ncbi:MAG: Rieske (2Fe-2S) protein [Candidatus Viridilinea halotolerans]|uniref:Rieske (2Fe-2S) protein n=1 Tax=Candidatus Viridilinea halotolerans TaxID=2491704 RepID=A0A426U851_9CHLR|nr:MAG: Rieske (2Fe-2S) protein [Candidatus Viridilinea halotolerans]
MVRGWLPQHRWGATKTCRAAPHAPPGRGRAREPGSLARPSYKSLGLRPPLEVTLTSSDLPTTLSRRDFLSLGLGALGLAGLLQSGAITYQFLAPRTIEGEFGGVVHAGELVSFPPGSVTEFPDGRFFLVRLDDGGLLAVYRRCTHLGCAVAWHPTEDRFTCPCHGSHFDQAGVVENPPAPRPLDTFAITLRDGQISVDTARPQRRDHFSVDQVVYG